MSTLDRTVATLSMKLANRVSRRSLLVTAGRGLGAVAGGSAVSLAFARTATATHQNESIYCLYHPGINSNSCPYCTGGSWVQCTGPCYPQGTQFYDCCNACTAGCHTHSDPSDPNGQGWSCCFTGYCGSGCSGQKVACRFWSCVNFC